ncbi:MAG: SIR2 family protein [Fluviicola sp.]
MEKDESGEYMFFQFRNITIGGGFDFGKLKRQIIDYFELYKVSGASEANDYKGSRRVLSSFESHKLFRTNKRDPYATAYRFTFNEEQCNSIESLMSGEDERWANLLWLTPDELKSQQDNWKEEQKFIFKERSIFEKTKFPNELRASLRNIAKARDNGKLVIFAGAGVSVDSGVPTWSELMKGLANDLNKSEDDSLTLAQNYHLARRKKEYQERIQDLLKHGNTRSNLIHEKVIEISPTHILTTNYDTHFEQVIEEKGYKYSIVKKDSDLPYTKGSSLLIKMHGDFDERNIVLKAEDYEKYSELFPLIEGFVKGIFASKLVLFIGFSFDDPNLRGIYKSVKDILDKDTQPPYFVTSSTTSSSRQEFESDFELKVIDIGSQESNRSIEYYFEKESNSSDSEGYKRLSKRGKSLYRFLDVVNRFDVISDSFEGISMDTLITSSIGRFSEFGAIPQKVIETIPPFSERGNSSDGELLIKAEMNDNMYQTLGSPNESLLEFLKDQKGDSEGIEFYSYPNDNDSSAKQKLDQCIKLLYMSLVHSVYRKNDDSSEVYKFLPQDANSCNCQGCLHDRFDYKMMLTELVNLSNRLICNQTTSDLGLTEAYGYFRTGQYVKAFHTLEEVRNIAWRQRKFPTFFLASHNQKLLRPFLWYSDCKDTYENELDDLRNRIDLIDLDQLLYELPLDKEVKHALKLVRDDDAFKQANDKIRKNHRTILEVYENYKKGGYRHSGSYYWYIVEQEHYALWNFYHKNRFFSDAYSPFIELTHKYLESMLASYKTSNNYQDGLKVISGYFLTTATLYAKPQKLSQLFSDYEIDQMEILNHDRFVGDYLEKFETFIKSGFKESEFMGYHLSENRLFSNALENSNYFQGQIESILNNHLILLSHIKLSPEDSNKILDLCLKLLKSNNILRFRNSLSYLEYFVDAHVVDLNLENLESVLKFVIERDNGGFDSVQALCSAIYNKKKLKEFLDEDFYKSLERKYIDALKDRSKEALFAIHPLLQKELQSTFSKEIMQTLLNADGNELITTAYYWGLWSPKRNKKIFDKFTTQIRSKSQGFLNYEINEDGLPINIRDFSVWNDLILLTIMVYRYDLFEDARIVEIRKGLNSKMFIWALNPFEYTYRNFDASWLFTFQSEEHIAVFKKLDSLKDKVKSILNVNFNPKIAEVYFKIL